MSRGTFAKTHTTSDFSLKKKLFGKNERFKFSGRRLKIRNQRSPAYIRVAGESLIIGATLFAFVIVVLLILRYKPSLATVRRSRPRVRDAKIDEFAIVYRDILAQTILANSNI